MVYVMIYIRPLIKLFTIITVLIIVLSPNCFSGIHFVSKTGTSTPPYLTWETASDSIQKCIYACNDGDTVYVANGIYKESLLINKSIALIGSSMDSTVIDGRGINGINTDYLTIDVEADCNIENFHIYGRDLNALNLIEIFIGYQTIINNCNLENANGLIRNYGSSSKIINSFGHNFKRAFAFITSLTNTLVPEVDNCIIDAPPLAWDAIYIDFGGNPVIRNNIILMESVGIGPYAVGIDINGWVNSATIENNLIFAEKGYSGVGIWAIYDSNDSVKIYNNNIVYDLPNDGIGVHTVNKNAFIRNNIIEGTNLAMQLVDTVSALDYNLIWNNNYDDISGLLLKGPHNLFADPMFVKDTSVISGRADYHLQAYSPAIDKGDTSILDKDGTRSDIGMYGGPWGERYEYRDLAPRPPHGLDVRADSGKITVRWNRNTEADFKRYKLYRDTVQHFTIDTAKLISILTDTLFIQVPQVNWKKYYYKLTAGDNQGNESPLSEEIGIITGINDKPQMVSEYNLFQNYPNPFNPSTKIGYRLKETGYVKIMVYDIKGALVKMVVNGIKEAGYNEVGLNGKGLASGIYIYRLEVIGKGNIPVYSDMKKMILLK